MKSSQLIIAFIVLIGMIFGLTFARIYLGNPIQQPKPEQLAGGGGREVNFLYKNYPPDPVSAYECEEHVKGWHDFWFHNPNKEPVQLGLIRTSCRCAVADAFVLNDERYRMLQTDASTFAATLIGLGASAPLAAAGGADPAWLTITSLA